MGEPGHRHWRGGLTVLIWKQLSGGLFDLYEIVPGFLVSVLLIVLFSLLGKKNDPAVAIEFEKQ